MTVTTPETVWPKTGKYEQISCTVPSILSSPGRCVTSISAKLLLVEVPLPSNPTARSSVSSVSHTHMRTNKFLMTYTTDGWLSPRPRVRGSEQSLVTHRRNKVIRTWVIRKEWRNFPTKNFTAKHFQKVFGDAGVTFLLMNDWVFWNQNVGFCAFFIARVTVLWCASLMAAYYCVVHCSLTRLLNLNASAIHFAIEIKNK